MKSYGNSFHKTINSDYEWNCMFSENLEDDVPQRIKFLQYANTGEKIKLKNIKTWRDLCQQIVSVMKNHSFTKVMTVSHVEKSGDSVIFYTDYFQ